MKTPITLDLAALRKIERLATPGPWRAAPGKGAAQVVAKEGHAIYINVRTCEHDDTVKQWQADARFIASARNAFGALLDRVEDLAAALDESERLRDAASELMQVIAQNELTVRQTSDQWKHNHDERKAERDAAKAACEYASSDRDAWQTRAESAEQERDESIARANLEAAHHEHLRTERDEFSALLSKTIADGRIVESMTVEAIAAWMDSERDDALSAFMNPDRMRMLKLTADAIRAGAWRKQEES